MTGEYIRFAAVQLNADLFVGKYHGICFKKLKSAVQQGFIATRGRGFCSRFVDRKEALEIAIDAGQKIDKHNPKSELLSEDLFEDDRYNI